MRNHVKGRTYETRLIESGEPINYRIIAEAVAKNILRGAVHNEHKR